MKYKGQVYYKQNSSLYKAYNGIYKNNNNDQNTDDYLDENMTIGWNWGMTHTLSYAFDVKENHFDVLVGTEYSREGNNMSETIEGHATTSIFGDFSHAYFNNFSGRTAGIVPWMITPSYPISAVSTTTSRKLICLARLSVPMVPPISPAVIAGVTSPHSPQVG